MKKHILVTAALSLLFQASAFAKTIEIKTLNNGKDGIMVFEPSFVKANKGDTVKFVPADAGHDVSSFAIPKGAKAFQAGVGKPLSVKVNEEGVYLYQCSVHVAMAMIGVIQVGSAKNLAEVKETASKDLAPKLVMNKERLDKYLGEVK